MIGADVKERCDDLETRVAEWEQEPSAYEPEERDDEERWARAESSSISDGTSAMFEGLLNELNENVRQG